MPEDDVSVDVRLTLAPMWRTGSEEPEEFLFRAVGRMPRVYAGSGKPLVFNVHLVQSNTPIPYPPGHHSRVTYFTNDLLAALKAALEKETGRIAQGLVGQKVRHMRFSPNGGTVNYDNPAMLERR